VIPEIQEAEHVGKRANSFGAWTLKKAWVDAYAHYLSKRSPILIQRKDPKNPTQNIPFTSTGPGNGSGTYIESAGRVFVATAAHVAHGFNTRTGFVTVPSVRPGIAEEMTCPILGILFHPTRDVALIEVPPTLPGSTGYSTVPEAEFVRDYQEVSRDPLMWSGYPRDLRKQVAGRVNMLGFHFAVSRPILSPARRIKALMSAIDADDPLDLAYDFFSLRLPHAIDAESGRKEIIDFTLLGLSGGGLWLLPSRPTRRELVDPSKIRFIGVESSRVPMPGRAKEEWIRASRAKTILEILEATPHHC
jgi:hypothetical protein